MVSLRLVASPRIQSSAESAIQLETMGALVSPCRDPRPDDDDDHEDDDDDAEARVSETWVCSQMVVQLEWRVQTPWTCNRCGAVWHRQQMSKADKQQ